MKHLCIPLIVCALPLATALKAQECSTWTNWDLRGTYTLSGSGYIDLSKTFPGAGLPSGLSPYYFVGAHAYDGTGKGTGWISFNMAGVQVNAQFVDYTYTMKSDCSVQASFKLKLTDLGVTSAPQASLKVIVPKQGADLEIHSIHVGAAFGKTPDASLNIEVMHRISMKYW